MKICNTIIILLCFLIIGCTANINALESELKAGNFMSRAEALENEGAYHQAAQIYGTVAEHYSSTGYHKRAVWKAALLNIHPANPEINYDAALSWLQVYLKLPLSSEEKETAAFYVSMIEHIHNLQAELSFVVKEKNKLLELTRKQSSDIESYTKRRKELEAELTHAWDELNKMKAVDVRMHRSRVKKSVAQPPQSVQKIPEIKGNEDETAPQNIQHVPIDQEFYPYMVQVSSYKNKEDAMREAMILRDKGDSVCISYARIEGKGEWYRVLVGFYRNPEEAQKATLELKEREYHQAFVVRPPFTVEVDILSSDEQLEKLKAHLISKGYSAYSLPSMTSKKDLKLLVGAFWTEMEASTVIKDLQKEGFKPKVVRR